MFECIAVDFFSSHKSNHTRVNGSGRQIAYQKQELFPGKPRLVFCMRRPPYFVPSQPLPWHHKMDISQSVQFVFDCARKQLTCFKIKKSNVLCALWAINAFTLGVQKKSWWFYQREPNTLSTAICGCLNTFQLSASQFNIIYMEWSPLKNGGNALKTEPVELQQSCCQDKRSSHFWKLKKQHSANPWFHIEVMHGSPLD